MQIDGCEFKHVGELVFCSDVSGVLVLYSENGFGYHPRQSSMPFAVCKSVPIGRRCEFDYLLTKSGCIRVFSGIDMAVYAQKKELRR